MGINQSSTLFTGKNNREIIDQQIFSLYIFYFLLIFKRNSFVKIIKTFFCKKNIRKLLFLKKKVLLLYHFIRRNKKICQAIFSAQKYNFTYTYSLYFCGSCSVSLETSIILLENNIKKQH